jgi:hypothetical protein
MKTKLLLMLFSIVFTVALSAVPVQLSHQDATFAGYSYGHGILAGFYYVYMMDGGDGIISEDDTPITNANGSGNVVYWVPGPPDNLWTPDAVTFLDAGTGGGQAEQGDMIYVKVYDGPDANADFYCVSQYPGDFLTVPTSGPTFLEAGLDFTWSIWYPNGSTPDIDWGDGVTGNVDQGVVVPGSPGSTYGTGLPNEDFLMNPANVGYYFQLTLDDATFPLLVTVEVDHVALGYAPYNAAYWYNGMWNYVPASGQLVWTDPMTDHASFSFTIGAKGAKADVDVPIVLADGPLNDDALPVTLSEFAVAYTLGNQFATIQWTTQSETNMSGYTILRSNDANFENAGEITRVDAINSTQEYEYNYTDETVEFNTTYYYWLEATSYDGITQYFGPSSINVTEPVAPQVADTTMLFVNYPNPFNPVTNIHYSIKEGETGTLEIYNSKGQKILTQTLNQTSPQGDVFTWNADKNASGVYFYKLKTDSYSEVKKMMMLK